MGRRGWAAVVVLLAGLVWLGRPLLPAPVEATPVPLDPTDPTVLAAGSLAYRGGLVLQSRDRHFGGLSAMRVEPDGEILALTDRGAWYRFRPEIRDGRLVGATGLVRGSVRDGSARLWGAADAEALASWQGGVLVGFERDHRLERFDDLRARGVRVAGPPLGALPGNGGIEALAEVGDLLLAIAEEGGDATRRPAWLGVPGDWRERAYAVVDGFVPTGAAPLPDGGVIVVERRYRPIDGVRARIVALDATHEPLLRGRELARLGPPLTVDNFEAVAVAEVAGERWVYVLSDDNFSSRQRTLLLAFALPRGDQNRP